MNRELPKTTYAADCRQAAAVCQHSTQRVKDLMRDERERDTWQRIEMGFVQFMFLSVYFMSTNVVGHWLMSPIKFHSNRTGNSVNDCRYVLWSSPKNVYQPNSCWFVGETPNGHVEWGWLLIMKTCAALCEQRNKVTAVQPAVSVWRVVPSARRPDSDRNGWTTSQERWMLLKLSVWGSEKTHLQTRGGWGVVWGGPSDKQDWTAALNHRLSFIWVMTWTTSAVTPGNCRHKLFFFNCTNTNAMQHRILMLPMKCIPSIFLFWFFLFNHTHTHWSDTDCRRGVQRWQQPLQLIPRDIIIW